MFSQKLNSYLVFTRLAKAQIRLHICAGLSEPLLVAHTTLLEISCHGSTSILIVFPNVYSVYFEITISLRRFFKGPYLITRKMNNSENL